MKVGHVFNDNFNSVLKKVAEIDSKTISVVTLSKIGDIMIWVEQVREQFFVDIEKFVEQRGGKVSPRDVVEEKVQLKFQFPPECENEFKVFYETAFSEDKVSPVVFTLNDLQDISKEVGLSVQDILALNPILVKA